MASRYGYTEVVRVLLSDDRVDPSANHNYAEISASLHGHTEIVQMLEEYEYRKSKRHKKNNPEA